jgi:hypothetical protein
MPRRTAVLLFILASASTACAMPQRIDSAYDFSVYEETPGHYHRTWRPQDHEDGAPEGATAKCRDGHYSFALERRAACSQHGGVVEWMQTL